MSMFSKIFRKGIAEDPLYIKLKNCLLKSGFNNKIQSAYFLFGLPNRIENLQSLKKRIADKISLKDLMEPNQYDVKNDIIEVYLIKTKSGQDFFILLLDPYELYAEEKILEMVPTSGNEFDFEPQLIFSSTQ